MTVSVGPNEAAPTHHISLTDGTTTLGFVAVDQSLAPDANAISRSPVDRNPLKTTSGSSAYTDFNYPYSVIAQDNWGGGRGAVQFEKDQTRFLDSCRVNTERSGQAILGGRDVFAVGLRAQEYDNLPQTLVRGATSYGVIITTAASMTKQYLYLYVKRSDGGTGTVAIYSGSTPTGSPIRTGTISAPVGNTYTWVSIDLTSGALAAGTYYLQVTVSGISVAAVGGGTTLPAQPFYRLVSELVSTDFAKFFEYKQQAYCTFGSKVYMNGDRGACDSNAGNLNKLIDASKSWTQGEWVGCVVKLIPSTGGTAEVEAQPWRVITGNDATSLTVSPNWDAAHNTSQNYVILGSDKWTEKLSLAANITDVVATKNSNSGIVYFALGTGNYIRRYRAYNNAGTWTEEDADDGTNTAIKLQMVYDATNGWELWQASLTSVAKASLVSWGTALTFGTAITFSSRVNGLQAYADNNQAETLWVFAEDGPWYIQSSKAVRLPLREMDALRSEKNGRASTVQGVYLFFSQGNGMERYYEGNLDDIGPNLGEGLPDGQCGPIVSMVAFPGRVYAAIAYEEDEEFVGKEFGGYYSTVLAYNGGGWHSVYKSPLNKRILNIFYQSLPGVPGRLWIALEDDLVYVMLPSETFDPLQDSDFMYAFDGELITPWINAGFADAYKYFRSIKLYLDQTLRTWFINGTNTAYVSVSYRLDDETDWTSISETFTDTPFDEKVIGTRGVSGRRIQLRFTLGTSDARRTPVLRASILESVTIAPTKHAYSLSVFLRDIKRDLHGAIDDDAQTVIAKLDEWSNSATPLQMRCVHPLFDSKDVFLMPSTLRAMARTRNNSEFGYMVSMLLQEA